MVEKPDDVSVFQSREAKGMTIAPMSVAPDFGLRSVVAIVVHEKKEDQKPLAHVLRTSEEVDVVVSALRAAQAKVWGPSMWGRFS